MNIRMLSGLLLFTLAGLTAFTCPAHASTCTFDELELKTTYAGTCKERVEVTMSGPSTWVETVFHCDLPGVGTLSATWTAPVDGPGDFFCPARPDTQNFVNLSPGNWNAYAVAHIIQQDGSDGSASTGDNYFTVTP